MKALKKYLCALFAALTALTVLLTGACANSENSGKIQIVCTIFPQYDWVRELTDGAENVEVTLLEDSGADLHNFKPSAADKVAILNSDLFVYIGGESDEWAETLLKNADREIRSLCLIDALGDRALTEEEGIQDSGEHDHDHDEIDEHIWLSLKNAEVLVSAIADELCAVEHAAAEPDDVRMRTVMLEKRRDRECSPFVAAGCFRWRRTVCRWLICRCARKKAQRHGVEDARFGSVEAAFWPKPCWTRTA